MSNNYMNNNNMNNNYMSINYMKKRRPYFIYSISIIFIFLFLIFFMSGCKSNKENASTENTFITNSSFLLNTILTITIYDQQDESLLEECFNLVKKYELIFSRTDEASELYALNHGTAPHFGLTYQISEELSKIIEYGLNYSALSKGAFDISIAPLTSLWNFSSENPIVPSEEAISKALSYIGYENIELNDNEITFQKEGISLDLGGIAKGYIADKVKEYLLAKGVKSAMINLGGNVLCVGKKPDGSPFKVGIQKPFADRNETIAVMEIVDYSVVSSGIYERSFTIDNIFYHHILNPKTGYSYDNDLVAVTIISKASVDGDGLSTTCFAFGLEYGLELIKSLPDTYAIFVTKDYDIYYSEGFHDVINVIE